MTIRTRNWIFILCMIYIGFLSIISFFVLFQKNAQGMHLTGSLLSMLNDLSNSQIIKGCLLSLCSEFVLVGIFFYFRRTASAEVFFLFIFIVVYPQEGILNIINILTDLRMPVYVMTLGYRLYFCLQFAGIFSLFSAGLFSNNFQYSKLEIFAGVVLLAAFTLAAFIPIDTTIESVHLFYFKEVLFLLIGIKILSVVNMLFAAYRQNSIDYIWIGVGTLLLIISREMQTYMTGPSWFGAGLLLFAMGITLYLRSLHKLYQWL